MIWEEDLTVGKKAELEFMCILSQSPVVKSIERPQGKFKDYDIKTHRTDWSEITYEVKVDNIYPTSKWVWIEYECKWVPSGIMTSKADYYVYKLDANFYIAPKWKLLELLMLSETKQQRQGWDDWTAKLWIIPEWEFLSVAKKV